MCRDVITIFEKEGARVRIQFVYNCEEPLRVPKYDMYPALKYPESDWRQDAIRFFDTATRIKDEHRAYRIENNDDYEPPSYQYDSELGYDSDADIYSNHGKSDDSVDEFCRDRHIYYRKYCGWDAERQYGSDFINWKNDLLNHLELETSKDWDYTDESPSPPRWEDVYPEPELRGPPDYDPQSE